MLLDHLCSSVQVNLLKRESKEKERQGVFDGGGGGYTEFHLEVRISQGV